MPVWKLVFLLAIANDDANQRAASSPKVSMSFPSIENRCCCIVKASCRYFYALSRNEQRNKAGRRTAEKGCFDGSLVSVSRGIQLINSCWTIEFSARFALIVVVIHVASYVILPAFRPFIRDEILNALASTILCVLSFGLNRAGGRKPFSLSLPFSLPAPIDALV